MSALGLCCVLSVSTMGSLLLVPAPGAPVSAASLLAQTFPGAPASLLATPAAGASPERGGMPVVTRAAGALRLMLAQVGDLAASALHPAIARVYDGDIARSPADDRLYRASAGCHRIK